MTVGENVVGNIDGAEQISRKLGARFAPDAIGSIFQDMVAFMYFKRTARDMDTYLMEFDMSRQKAEARMIMGNSFPDDFVSVPCVQNA